MDRALRDHQAALTGDASYVPALYNIGVLEATAHPKTAMELYDRVVKIEPDNADAHLNLGFVLEMLGRKAAARAHLVEDIRLQSALASLVPVADGGTA